jgi:hypothetical protein
MLRRLFLAIILVLLSSISLFAKTKIQGIASLGGQVVITSGIASTTKVVKSFPSCTVTVFLTGTSTLATIYSDDAGTPKANPFTAGADASFAFYVDSGRFDVRFSNIPSPFTLGDILAGPTVFMPSCSGTDDTTAFSSLISQIGSTPATIKLPYLGSSRCAVSNLTIPFNITLSNRDGGSGIKVITGQTLTVNRVDNADGTQIFYNATAGLGTVKTGLVSGTSPGACCGRITPYWWGAVGDNTNNDYPALQAMSYFSLGQPTVEHGDASAGNVPIYLPPGFYNIGANIWSIKNAVAIDLRGAGRQSTRVIGTAASVLRIDGLWYSHFEGFALQKDSTVAGAIFDIDGNVPLHAYTTRSNQQNTFVDLQISGASGTAADTIGVGQNINGGSSAQGENLWINPNISSVRTAFYNNGFNAIVNTIIRGDMQDFVNGIYSVAGWVNVFGTSFESTHPYYQATEGGFDIKIGSAGVLDKPIIEGVRTESFQFFQGGSTQPATIQNVVQQYGGTILWGPAKAIALHDVLIKDVATAGQNTVNHAFQASVAGTTRTGFTSQTADIFGASTIGNTTFTASVNQFAGNNLYIDSGTGAGQVRVVDTNTSTTLHVTVPWSVVPDATSVFSTFLEPTWTATGSLSDGSVTWAEMPFKVVDTTSISGTVPNTIAVINCSFGFGSGLQGIAPVSIGGWNYYDIISATFTSAFAFQRSDWQWPRRYLGMDTTSAGYSLTLNDAPIGQVAIVKHEVSANTATLAGGTATIDGVASLTIPLNGVVQLLCTANNVWKITANNYGADATTLNGASFAAPGTIGGTTPGAATFTTLIANTSLAINGGTALTTTNRTGTGNLVLATSPSLTTPDIGAALGTSLSATSFLKVNNTGKLTVSPKTNDVYSNAMTIDVSISHHVIAVSNTTSATSTWTPSTAGSAGDMLYLTTVADGTGTVTVTFAATFHSSGTQATTLSRFSTIAFVSDGVRWVELYRTTALASLRENGYKYEYEKIIPFYPSYINISNWLS